MEWWRAHHGLPNDPKLAVTASKCKVRRGEVLEVWVTLLDFASQNHPRGSVTGFDCEQAAWVLEMAQGTVERIVSMLTDRGMIDSEGFLTNWDKRNPKREREDDSIERVRKFREKQNATKRHVTPSNAQIDREIEEIDRKKEKPRAAQSASSSSSESDLPEMSMRTYGSHPKKTGKVLAEQALCELARRGVDLAEVERCHAAWCKTEAWTKENGRYAPPLAQWLLDDGWTKWPEKSKSSNGYVPPDPSLVAGTPEWKERESREIEAERRALERLKSAN